jgi:multidrug transporter EmrE-like cation transporter
VHSPLKTLIASIALAASIVFGVISQLIIKWQVLAAGNAPEAVGAKIMFAFALLTRPFVVLSIILTFLSGVAWMIAMTRFDLSFGYPFMGISFALILIASGLFFHEPITTPKILGTALIMLGILVASQG